MRNFVVYLAKALAAKPEEVVVTETMTDKGPAFELTVADEDLNHLIGKQGRTVKAMRALLAVVASRSGSRCFLKISAATGAGVSSGEPEVCETEQEQSASGTA